MQVKERNEFSVREITKLKTCGNLSESHKLRKLSITAEALDQTSDEFFSRLESNDGNSNLKFEQLKNENL